MLNLPYRPPLPTAKWVATIQELSGGRLRLGVGLGWMEAEFRALGVPRSARGRLADETLEFLRRCFAGDEVDGERPALPVPPAPAAPPIFVGGAAPHALARAVRFGDGWMPMGATPRSSRPPSPSSGAGRARPGARRSRWCAWCRRRADEPPAETAAPLRALRDVGVTRVIARASAATPTRTRSAASPERCEGRECATRLAQ